MRSLIPLFLVALAASAPALAIENVPVPAFRAIELHGGGNVTVVPAPAQRVILEEGSSQFTRVRVDRNGKLVIDACTGRCPAIYRLRIRVETPRLLAIGVNGGGLVRAASGFAPQSDIGLAVHGGGEIDVRSIDTANVGATVDGGGEIFVRARTSLGAAVRGGGEIRYWGNPTVATSINGGGMVRRGG